MGSLRGFPPHVDTHNNQIDHATNGMEGWGSSFILTPGDVVWEDWWRITANGVATVGRWTMTRGNC